MPRWFPLTLLFSATVLALALTVFLARPGARAGSELEGAVATVIKAPACDCCEGFAAALRDRGAEVVVVTTNDIVATKRDRNVPESVWSCHTTELDGYVIEGHVPLDALERLLTERPDIDGLGMAGMPAGSPGMGGVQSAPFEVMELRNGAASLFGRF